SPWVSYALRTAWISSSSRPASTSRTSEPLKITMSPSCMARAPVVPARDVRCRHHAWLAFRSSPPEMRDVAKVLRDPLVGIDGIEVAFSAAVSIDREDPGAQVVIPNVLGAASERAARPGGDEEAVDPSVQFRRDLVHRGAIVRLGIGQVGILVGPDAVLDGLQEGLDATDPCVKELSRHRIGF